jgi:hypothetical protein
MIGLAFAIARSLANRNQIKPLATPVNPKTAVRQRTLLAALLAIVALGIAPEYDTAAYVVSVLVAAVVMAVYGDVLYRKFCGLTKAIAIGVGYTLWYVVLPIVAMIGLLWGFIALVKFMWMHS